MAACGPGVIEKIRFLPNGHLVLKLDTLMYENYATRPQIHRDVFKAFAEQKKIVLKSNKCQTPDYLFHDFEFAKDDD